MSHTIHQRQPRKRARVNPLRGGFQCGPMLTQIETATLRALLQREAAPIQEFSEGIAAGDVVQIRPAADRTFGGMLALVMQAKPHQLRAILLRAHRGGCREAWMRLTPPEVAHVGRAHYQAGQTPFSRRCECKMTGCAWAP